MHSPSNEAEYDELVQLVVKTLPESITQREHRLQDLLAALPDGYRFRPQIVRMLLRLEEHERDALEFPKLFEPNPLQKEGTDGKRTAEQERGSVDGSGHR